MIVLMRDVRRLTQQDLAEKLGVRQAYVSLIEGGRRELPEVRIPDLAEALDCPPELLSADAPVRAAEAGELHFRRRKTLPVADRRELEGKLHLGYLTVRGLLDGVDFDPALPIPDLDVDEVGDAAIAAAYVRRLWRIPAGPIVSMTAYLEAAGVFLIPCDTHGKVDAVTRRCDEGWHVTAFNRGAADDRVRFTKAHELGHLVLHRHPGPADEDEANAFASEFLAPGDQIIEDLRELTTRQMSRLLDLRLHWRVSVPFLVRRARDLGCITDRQYKSFQPLMNRFGLLHAAPDARLPEEAPQLLDQIVSLHTIEHGLTAKELAGAALMTRQRFVHRFQPSLPAESRRERTLRSV
jgi:Zn-dependent peptidase ImmA (M78 family)/DNA-binding XRE family transcriptional regulator